MLMKHLSEPVPSIVRRRPDVPAALVAVVERALAKRPEDRWPDATAMRDAIRAEGVAVPAPQPAAVAAAEPPSRAAAALGGRGERRPDFPVGLYPAAPLPHPDWPVPPLASRADWKAARRGYQAQRRLPPEQWDPQWGGGAPRRADPHGQKPVEDRIRNFRRSLGGYGAVVAGLGAINALTTPWFPWFLFPTVGMGIPILIQLGSLWADRVKLGQIFGRDEAAASAEVLAKLAPPEVLGGPHGAVLRAAIADQTTILGTVARLQASDKSMLPDVAPTVQGLVERVAALAAALTRIDADVSPEMLPAIETRLDEARRAGGEGPDRERKLALLERQRSTVADLIDRRARLASQLEGAGLMIESIKLDLLKLRSAGVGSALTDVTNATQEARALSRDIGYVLDAAAEVRKL
jgi:serine/threonine-protein kinase